METSVRWDKRFLGLAAHIAQWSKDPSTQCGAVIVRPDRTIASLGFNGFPMGISDVPLLTRGREEKLDRMVHAEMNALLFVAVRPHNHTLYTWPFGPCCRCASHVIQSGIRRVVAPLGAPERWTGSLKVTRELFYEADVEFLELPGSELIGHVGCEPVIPG